MNYGVRYAHMTGVFAEFASRHDALDFLEMIRAEERGIPFEAVDLDTGEVVS